jgi:hypothetical protein
VKNTFDTITNHGFLKGSSWLFCTFWLKTLLEWHMYFLID